MTKLITAKMMADEVLSIYKKRNIIQYGSLPADILYTSFKAEIGGLQIGVNYLINKGLLDIDIDSGEYVINI